MPIIILYQKCSSEEKNFLKTVFDKENREEDELKIILEKIKKYNIINECYKKAEYFINLASNSLSIFEDNQEKEILKNLTSFTIERNF